MHAVFRLGPTLKCQCTPAHTMAAATHGLPVKFPYQVDLLVEYECPSVMLQCAACCLSGDFQATVAK